MNPMSSTSASGEGRWPQGYYYHGRQQSQSQRREQDHQQEQDRRQGTLERMSSVPSNRDNSGRERTLNNRGNDNYVRTELQRNEHNQRNDRASRNSPYQRNEYRYSTTLLSSFNDDPTNGFDFPMSTARLGSINPSFLGGATDDQGTYGSLSRVDPVLLPPVASFRGQSNAYRPRLNGAGQMGFPVHDGRRGPGHGDPNDTEAYLGYLEREESGPSVRQGGLTSARCSSGRGESTVGGGSHSIAGIGDPSLFLRDGERMETGHDHPTTSTRHDSFLSHDRASVYTSPSEKRGPTRILSPARDRRANDYFIHSQDHRKKFLGASSSQIFVKWLDEESGGMNPSSHLKHGMTSAEEMIIPGQLELCHHPLPPQPELETYIATYFRTFHVVYPVVEEPWLRAQLDRPKAQHMAAAAGEDVVAPVVYLVVSLGASMSPGNQSTGVSKTYLDQAWKALSVIMGRPFRSSVQALVLLAVAFRLVSRERGRGENVG